MLFNSLAAQELYQAGIRSCNFVANRQNLFATDTPSQMIEEVQCFDANGAKLAVTGLTYKLNFIFTNPSILREDTSRETRCAFFNPASVSWEALPTTLNGVDTLACHTDHLSTFGLATFARSPTPNPATDQLHSQPAVVLLVAALLAVLLVGVELFVFCLFDRPQKSQEARLLEQCAAYFGHRPLQV